MSAFAGFLSKTFVGTPDPSYDYFSAIRTSIGAEALAQHHEFPTNLIDFTFDPLVALYFATREGIATNVMGCPSDHGVIYGCTLASLGKAKNLNLFSACYDLLPPVHVGRIYQQRGILINCGFCPRSGNSCTASMASELEKACVRLFFPREYPTVRDVEDAFSNASMAYWMADEPSYWHTPQTEALQNQWYIAYEWYLNPLSALRNYCARGNGKFDPAKAAEHMFASIKDRPAPWLDYMPEFESPSSRAGRLAEYFGTAAKLVLDACRLYTRRGTELHQATLQCFVDTNPTFFAAMNEFVARVDLLDVIRLNDLIMSSIMDPTPLSNALTEQQLERLRDLPRVMEDGQVRYFGLD